MTQNIQSVVDELLADLAYSKGLTTTDLPSAIISSSLDQMRFLVSLEDRLDVMIELGDEMPFDLNTRESFLRSVEKLVASAT